MNWSYLLKIAQNMKRLLTQTLHSCPRNIVVSSRAKIKRKQAPRQFPKWHFKITIFFTNGRIGSRFLQRVSCNHGVICWNKINILFLDIPIMIKCVSQSWCPSKCKENVSYTCYIHLFKYHLTHTVTHHHKINSLINKNWLNITICYIAMSWKQIIGLIK